MRAMKDPFPPARQAGILAMAATHNYFTLAESTQKLLPALCCVTTDPDKGVRDQASCHHLSFSTRSIHSSLYLKGKGKGKAKVWYSTANERNRYQEHFYNHGIGG